MDGAPEQSWPGTVPPPPAVAGFDTFGAVAATAKTEPIDEIERMLFDTEPLSLDSALAGDYGALYDALRSAHPEVSDPVVSDGCRMERALLVAIEAPPASPPPRPTDRSANDDGNHDGDHVNDDDNKDIETVGSAADHHGASHDDGDNDDDDSEEHGLGVVAALDAKYGGCGGGATSGVILPSPPSSSTGCQKTQQQQQQHGQGGRGQTDAVRRAPPLKTKYRDAPVPLDGRAYNPVRFQYDGNIFEYPTRPPSGEYREFSGHADESATTPSHLFAVYVIDDTERKKGATKRCLLQRDRVRDIVWSLPERRDANGRALHGVPPTPQDQYDVRVDPSVAGLPMSSVPVHNRTRVFLTVRNPPPTEPLIAFTVGPVPDPARMDPFDFIRGQLASLGTPDAAAVLTTRGESLDMLVAKHDLVNLNQEVSLAVPARHMLGVRSGLVARGLLVKDKMFRERALRIGPMAPALLKREAVGLVDRCRAAGLSDNQIVLSAEMPLRTYVILRLCDLGSELYSEAYLADERFRNMFKDRGPAHLSPPQTVQLSDAFYWVYLAPQDQRRPEFEEVIRFYQQRGVEVRLKKPHVKSGSSVGRTSESGALRHFKPHSKATHSVLRSRYEIVAPSGEVQALRTVKPRTKTLSPSERNPAAARLDRIAAEAARRPRAFEQSGTSDVAGARLGRTGIARFLKPTASVKVETATTPSLAMPQANAAAAVVPAMCGAATSFSGGVHVFNSPVVADGSRGLVNGASLKPVVVAPDVLDHEEEKKPIVPFEPLGALPATSRVAHAAQGVAPSCNLDARTLQETRGNVLCDAAPTATTPMTRPNWPTPPTGLDVVAAAVAAAATDEDILSLHRKAIAFPDPVIVGAPPEGMVETVLTWASVRDKIPEPAPPAQPLPQALTPTPPKATKERKKTKRTPKATAKAAKKERAAARGKRDKHNKKQSKRQTKKQAKKAAAAGEHESNGGERLGKRQRDASTRAGGMQPMPLPPPVDAAALLKLLPRQGEPLFLPIIRLLPPDGTSAMPGFGAPYVRLPCPVPSSARGPVRVLLQQLPLVLPTTDLRHTVPITPHPAMATSVSHQHQPPPTALPPTQPSQLPSQSQPPSQTLSQQQQQQQQCQVREEQPEPLATSIHNDADWLNLLSAMDADA
ncbi:hypothetical protein pmac_cds_287 [Pandoravirus macleodensis]|uniref:Uncharacterized protein n=1 Tax=Pandoravirus macleodensis TaxID=2107707 RepID=A0A2U7UF35_9VIRU|nr:hypothetical protein pmac_cds_287 [Pandoravirus macleodensis]AVK76975.1 hypothetical protein pmac_cds_287 [Pandoravirus macleodensis]